MAREKVKFTHEVIKAIEELELRRARRSPEQLADAAWQKLQYDLPVVEVAELQALLQQLGSSLQGKTGWPCYCLTDKALENITTGARRSTSVAPELSEQEQQLQKMLTASISNTLHKQSSSSKSSLAAAATNTADADMQPQQQPQIASEQELYQQLCAVLLLQYVAKAVSMPEQSAWQLLLEYQPERNDDSIEQCNDPLLLDQQQGGMPAVQPAAATAAAAAVSECCTGAAANGCANTSSSREQYALQEAAVQDNDDEEYEAIEDPVGSCPGSSHSTGPLQQQQQQYSWEALQHKFLALGHVVHYSLMNCERVWKEQAAAQHLLQLLRAVGVHSHNVELQPVLHAYVGLLVDRLAAMPAQLPLLQQLWEALGLTGCQLGAAGGGRWHDRTQGLPAEAVLGFSVAAAVWQQLPGGSARSTLWRMMHQHLLPLLEQCSEQLAYSSSSSSKPQQQQQQQHAVTDSSSFAHVLLVSHIVELLLLGRPAGVDVSGQLTALGVMRNLVQLLLRHGGEASAEPLRRAVLLACCGSPATADWVLAVPAVLQQLEQPQFQPGHAAESHGAVWQMLLSRKGTQGHGSSSSSGACAAQCDQLLGLLMLSPDDSGNLQRVVVCLQLLVDVQKAAGRHKVWDQQVFPALRELAAALKESSGMPTPHHPDGSSSSSSKAADERVCYPDVGGAGGSVADVDDDHGDRVGADQSDMLNRRQAQQLQPTALRLIKDLLNQGGKTD